MKDELQRKQSISLSLKGEDLQRLDQMTERLNSLGASYTRSSLVREIIAFFVSKNGMKLFEAGLENSLDLFKDVLAEQSQNALKKA